MFGRPWETACLCWRAGNKERYGGTEFALTDLVEKHRIDIVVVRWVQTGLPTGWWHNCRSSTEDLDWRLHHCMLSGADTHSVHSQPVSNVLDTPP